MIPRGIPLRYGKAPEVNLGDLLRAVSSLKPTDPTTSDAIARLLGYDLPTPTAMASEQQKEESGTSPLEVKRGASKPISSLGSNRSRSKRKSPADSPGRRLIAHRPPGQSGDGIDDVLRGPAVAVPDPSKPFEPSPTRQLLNPKTVRSIVFFALATVAHEGEIDVEALSRFLCFEEKWSGRLPRLPRPTARLGVHVVFDRRPAMAPFYRDQNSLFDIISSVVGEHRTTYSTFRSAPEEVLSPKPSFFAREALPKPDIPTLLLSGVGIGSSFDHDRVPPAAWTGFFASLRKSGSPAVAFVPYPAERWPSQLAGHAALICWDRPTTPSVVRKRIGIGHEIQSEL
ncbi:hypothetical protein [Bradyrhizobium sp. th.b2]|uniref:hypothetical protein n=1 Tax=Bradyrhizobium sp. th-b2 TaxID=172088 RepID=UPI000490381A|nr:hypothetical protein [Bradyrhizobium sp. th.b2]